MDTKEIHEIVTTLFVTGFIAAMVRKGFARAGVSPSNASVEDVTSETMVKLLKGALDAYDPDKGAVKTLVGTIAKNAAIDSVRCKGNQKMKSLDGERAVDSEDGEEATEALPSVDGIFCTHARFASPDAALLRKERNAIVDAYIASCDQDAQRIWSAYCDGQSLTNTDTVRVSRMKADMADRFA